MKEINWEELGEIQDGNHGWRAALAHDGTGHALGDLSGTYVPGEGDNPEAFIIGEAPGAQEEMQRRPFVGPAGVVMRDLMALAGLYTEDWEDKERKLYGVANCWLTNVVKFRPPKNRKPFPMEVAAARPWLLAEWKAVGRPKLIIPVGGTALHAVTGKPASILRAAGKCHRAVSRCGLELFIWPMVHPSFGLRTPAIQPLLEKDWEKLGEWRGLWYG